MQTRLAGTVCKCFESGDPQPIDTSDIDNTGRVLGRAGALQQRCEESRDVENTVKVQGKDPCPRGRRVFVVWGTPVRTRVIDKNVELWIERWQSAMFLADMLPAFNGKTHWSPSS